MKQKIQFFLSVFILFGIISNLSTSNAQASELLSLGSKGNEVYDIQAKLQRMGYLHTNPTGYYGHLTTRAVKDFQFETGLYVDGMIEDETLNQINTVEMMGQVVHGEARGESYVGKVAVAAVILNRFRSDDFPNTISGVIFQPNAFTAVNDGQYYLTPNTTDYRAVIDAIKGWDPTGNAVYYYNPEIATDEWIFTRNTITQINNHVFAE